MTGLREGSSTGSHTATLATDAPMWVRRLTIVRDDLSSGLGGLTRGAALIAAKESEPIYEALEGIPLPSAIETVEEAVAAVDRLIRKAVREIGREDGAR